MTLQHLRTLFHGEPCADDSSYLAFLSEILGRNAAGAAVKLFPEDEAEARRLIEDVACTGKESFASYTPSGHPIYLLRPEETPVLVSDALLALGRLGRYTGCIPVTVLEHLWNCLHIARQNGLSELETAYVVMHDLHEAYTLDQPTSHKQAIPLLRRLDEQWERHVHRSLGFEWPVPPGIARAVHSVDMLALGLEAKTHHHPAQVRMMRELDIVEEPGGLRHGSLTCRFMTLPTMPRKEVAASKLAEVLNGHLQAWAEEPRQPAAYA